MKESLEQKLERFKPCAERVPGVVEVHRVCPETMKFSTILINQRGMQELGIQNDSEQQTERRTRERFFNNANIEALNRKLRRLLATRDPRDEFSYFQQLKDKAREEWVWYIGSIRIFHQEEGGHPSHVVTVSFPIDRMEHISTKAERFLAENEFFRDNIDKFLELGKRAREVLRLVAQGKSSQEIAELMEISVDTVHTHRKRIKKKLGISTSYEFTRFARAFDLL